ncbi:MAG TPA: response regulator transcription factor [Spongiibacteraceae bacterium]|nr:response regulator transcription factor [Spongiibacteraceae bacterium]
MRLLLVEDDRLIGRGVYETLRDEGYAVDWVRDGNAAEAQLKTRVHDLVILDLGLPGQEGLSILRKLRAEHNDIAVLIVTAREAPSDRVLGLDSGADDYLTKPFDLDELSARIRALLRRRAGRADPVIMHRDVSMNLATHHVEMNGLDIALTTREFALLRALLERPGAILSREQLKEKLYAWGHEVESNTVEVYVHSLRKRLGADFIVTVRGVGYTVVSAQ